MGRPRRASDADRERVLDLLRVRCAEGYLSVDTLSRRVDATYRARTANQLEDLVVDLPRRLSEQARTAWRRLGTFTAAGSKASGVDGGSLAVSAAEVDAASGRMVLGRSTVVDVRLRDPSVSRRHAALRHEDGRWTIEDLGSLNGTVVNGRRVSMGALAPGDRIELGDLGVTFEPVD